jgi:phosphoglycerol geranylgeranyltransferase
MNIILDRLVSARQTNSKLFGLLIDPDKTSPQKAILIAGEAITASVDFILVGGSLVLHNELPQLIRAIKDHCGIPIILFPGSVMQINPDADAILLLSLISGRNPEYLIGKHVEAAFLIKSSGLEVIPTGYMLIESGNTTTVKYVSNTVPIPSDKNEIASCTALAGEQLGLRSIYLEAGSGALNPVPSELIASVCANINLPVIVGGGIRSVSQALDACKAGATLVVVGNGAEDSIKMIHDIADSVHAC